MIMLMEQVQLVFIVIFVETFMIMIVWALIERHLKFIIVFLLSFKVDSIKYFLISVIDFFIMFVV